jgi:AcrR family transcriptional regulator
MNQFTPTLSTNKPRDRIFSAALSLFAERGFNAVGVRELARTAGVNPAMINYYFGSKTNILKEIIDTFFTPFIQIIEKTLSTGFPPEQTLRLLVRRFVEYFRNNQNMMRIALTEMPYNKPEIADHKAKYVNAIRSMVTGDKLPASFMNPDKRSPPLEIFAPALIGMILTHFILSPVIERTGGVLLDDSFYDKYPDILSDIFLHGVFHAVRTYFSDSGEMEIVHA